MSSGSNELPSLIAARFVWPRADWGQPARVLEGGGVMIAAGRVVEVLENRRAVERARGRGLAALDLGDALLVPGAVCAHAHLELSALEGRVPAGTDFAAWIRALLSARSKLDRDALARGFSRGARALLESGTTAVGDIDSLRLPNLAQVEGPLRRAFYEFLDARDPERTHMVLNAVRSLTASPTEQTGFGLSAHAPYTVSTALLRGMAGESNATRAGGPLRVQVHWAETAEEQDWWHASRGPLAELMGQASGAGEETSLAWLASAGLLNERLTLVHGNYPQPGDIERIAAAGATLVHCPGTHAFFEREPFDLGRYTDAGVRVALGTDSAASNDSLDMLREVGLLRRAHPALNPNDAWSMATTAGAEALGWAGSVGALAPAARADLAALDVESRSAAAAIDELTSHPRGARRVWLSGKPIEAVSESAN